MRRQMAAMAVGLVGLVPLVAVATPAGAVDSPLSVTPYSGFNSELARAPYITDLGQTSAYVNWATTVATPGSVTVAPMSGTTCPSSVTKWSSAAIGATTALPPAVVNGSTVTPPPSMSGWAYSLVNGSGTTVPEYQDSVQLTGLTAGTSYCYSVFSTNSSGAADLLPSGQPDQSFTTLVVPSTTSTKTVTFDVMGDTGENYASTSGSATTDVGWPNGVNPDEASLYSQIGASNAQFLLMAGDVSYSGGTQSTYGDLQNTGTDPEVSNIFGPSYYPETGGIPTYTADGNHGQNVTTLRVWPSPSTAETSGGTYDYDSYSGVDGISGSAPDNWYAFSTANVRVYVLDAAWADTNYGSASGSECGPNVCQSYQADADEHWQTSSPEYQWLQNDLATHPGGIKFAVFHYPLQSDNATQPSDPYLENDPSVNPNASSSLEALLANNGVDMAFTGHAHTYQRFVPPTGSGRIISYVTGGGGAALEPVQGGTTCASLQANESVYALGWSQSGTDPNAGHGTSCGPTAPTSAADVYNFLQVSVTGTSVTVSPTNAAGKVFDPQTYSFGASSGSTPTAPTFVRATATSSTSIQVDWSPSTVAAPATIAYYTVYRNGTPIGSVNSPATGTVDNGVKPGTLYTYTVRAFDSSANQSAPGTSNRLATPSAPSSLSATATSSTSVALTWTGSSESGSTINSYQIDRNGTPVGSTTAPVTTFSDTGAQPGTGYTYTVTAIDATGGTSSPATANPVTTPGSATLPFTGPVSTACMSHLPAGSVVGAAAMPDGSGYVETDVFGDVAVFGGATCYGAMTGTPLNKPIVGMAVDPATSGYWLVASDGGIFSFNAPFLGSTGGIHLNQPIVGMASNASGSGYWMVASDGGVFSFGVPFYGSTGGIHLNKPIVGMAVDPATGGYWLVASDGGVFSFNAPFFGSTGGIHLNKPIVSMASLAGGQGYRLIASDGGVFDFNAPFYGSTGNIVLNRPVIAGLDDPAGDGYWLIASDGGVFSYHAPFDGSAA